MEDDGLVDDSVKADEAYNGTEDKSDFYPDLEILEQNSSRDGYAGKKAYLPDRLLQILTELKTQCTQKILTDPPTTLDKPNCERSVDYFGGCWPDTRAGSIATIKCPPIPAFSVRANAHRQCTENGTWFENRTSGMPYINWNDCLADDNSTSDDTKYIYIFIGGFSLSLVMLTISLVIFFRFKQLQCDRITIHKNLFISYALTGVSWILYYMLVAMDGDVLLGNPIWCRGLHVICQYFTVCNFLWMFCEGLYLNTVIVYAFQSAKRLIIICYFIGWGLPLVLTTIYAAVRNTSHILTIDCWIEESKYQWIMFGPVVCSIIVNAMFLINIVRLLITKLRQMPEVAQTRKATRATLILVPMLGLQYLLLPIRPPPESKFEEVYHILVALLISTQGAFVSLIYCFCNNEVITVMRRKYTQHKLMHKRNSWKSSSGPAPGFSISDNVPLNRNDNILTQSENTERTHVEKDSV